ncbi:MAG: cyclophilin-like fold protein [Phycisphaerae bacterium]|nr:cyclophilin-like fold protein [Phycisphaerae bacterium]
MTRRITITAGTARFEAQLNDTATALAIMEALPIEARASRWGGEIYFSVPVGAGIEPGAREVVQAGEIGFWLPGSAFCIFFGRTPASESDEIRAASAVNIVGRIEGNLDDLWNVPNGAKVSLREFSESL